MWTGAALKKSSILIRNGTITAIGRNIPKDGVDTLKAEGKIALPGLIDAHVHLRDMELSYKEDFTTGTMAAAAGGFTTVLDMPNTKPATDSSRRMKEKIRRARGRILTNVGFHAAAITDSQEVREMAHLGAISLKLYMPRPVSPINVDDDAELIRLFGASRRSGLPLTVHAEEASDFTPPNCEHPTDPIELAKGRPARAEANAVERVLNISERARCRVHFCHLTVPSSISSIKKGGRNFSTEVTPHHILLSSNDLVSKGWRAWMVPPLRDEQSRRRLFAQVIKGIVDVMASDHAPHTIQEKSGGTDPPPGIPGLETTLPLMLTVVNKGILSLSSLVQMCSTKPARIFGLRKKGSLKPGFDGDVTIIDLKSEGRLHAESFYSKAKYTPFENMQVRGRVHATVVGGRVVFSGGEILANPGTGSIVSRDPAA